MTGNSIRFIRAFALVSVTSFLISCGTQDMSLRGLTGQSSEGESQTTALSPSSQSLPSTKATASFSDVAIMDQGDVTFTTIMGSSIKTSNRSLFVDMSMECGLLTQTLVRSKGGTKDTSTASAAVMVRVLVDGKVAAPGEVTYCQRTQELSATFGGILQSCTDVNGDGTILASECEFTDEELSLLLSTMNANSFNFISDGLASGVHKVEVQARIVSSTSAQTGSAEARGFIGKGTVLINSERLGR